MLEQKTVEGTDEVLTAQPSAIENFVICDLPGFADFADQLPTEKKNVGKEGTRWWGGMTYQQSVAALRYGDMAGVAASDKLLAEMETLVPVSQSWRTHNSVVGMCPDVPQSCPTRARDVHGRVRLTRAITSNIDGGRSGAYGPYPLFVNGTVQRPNHRAAGTGVPRLFWAPHGREAVTQGAPRRYRSAHRAD